jgi:hypothetical protein
MVTPIALAFVTLLKTYRLVFNTIPDDRTYKFCNPKTTDNFLINNFGNPDNLEIIEDMSHFMDIDIIGICRPNDVDMTCITNYYKIFKFLLSRLQ